MHISKVKYMVVGEPVVAMVRADNQEEALEILRARCDKEDNFTLRDIVQYDDETKGVLLTSFL